jgi:hypothetical protein
LLRADYRSIDFCGDDVVFGWGSATGAGADFDIDHLDSASASIDILLSDGRTVSVSLAWTGTGDVRRDRELALVDDGVVRTTTRFFGSYRQADVAGAAVLDGEDLLDGSLALGQLISAKGGVHTIERL